MEKSPFENLPQTPEEQVLPTTPEIETPTNSAEEGPKTYSLEERALRIEKLRNYSEMIGFYETEEMKGLHKDTDAWTDAASKIIAENPKDNDKSKNLILGYQLALAAIYYKQEDKGNYLETLDCALYSALVSNHPQANTLAKDLLKLQAWIPDHLSDQEVLKKQVDQLIDEIQAEENNQQ